MKIPFALSYLADDIQRQPLYWLSMILAMAGAYLSSDASAMMRGLGFFVWIFSNGYVLLGFYRGNNIPMTVTFIFYEVMNVRGVMNNWWP